MLKVYVLTLSNHFYLSSLPTVAQTLLSFLSEHFTLTSRAQGAFISNAFMPIGNTINLTEENLKARKVLDYENLQQRDIYGFW